MTSAINVQPYADALFALLSGLGVWASTSQRLKSHADLGQGEQPHLCVPDCLKIRTTQAKQYGMPPRITLEGRVWIWARVGKDKTDTPGHVINPLIRAVTAAIQPSNYHQTLGGIAHRCQVEGTILTDQGLIQEQGLAIIPVTIYVFGG